ncbi:PGPGW domain-containing protein [Thermobifida halotolerans]|nr:PGPGW domain-containing protein [Thermobifida halotolerans]
MSANPVAGANGVMPVVPEVRRRGRRWRRLRARARLWRRRMHSHPVLRLTWRITIGVIGSVILLGGAVMCVTPGPGIGGIIVGLAILATEFSWARHLLWRARRYASQMRSQATEKLREHRRRSSA